MNNFLACLFLLTTLIRPAAFLCVGSSGKSQLGFGYSTSCATSPIAEFGVIDADDRDCMHVAISTSSLTSNRFLLDPPGIVATTVTAFDGGLRQCSAATHSIEPGTPLVRANLLSSIVIRC